MTLHALATTLLIGSAVLGLWVAVRFPRWTPATTGRAVLFVAGALLLPTLALPILQAALAVVPPAVALLLAVLPVFVAAFALQAWVVRYAVGALGSAIR